jgi:hypothetical protein
MAKSIDVIRKKRGRPATGTQPLIALRMPPSERKAIESWANQRGLTLSKAIRELCMLAIAGHTIENGKAGQAQEMTRRVMTMAARIS